MESIKPAKRQEFPLLPSGFDVMPAKRQEYSARPLFLNGPGLKNCFIAGILRKTPFF
ncbi:hypothetical protein ABE504_24365 [Paenibacillus oryzisoli]|uniref:hypothetical protein n=1 Tax=Paenibacillus oryzisoli TaxID=1850517 RepID=UPI003D2B2CF9